MGIEERLGILKVVAAKVLRNEPKRHRRERIYQGLKGVITDADLLALRIAIGDTDDNRDTKDGQQ